MKAIITVEMDNSAFDGGLNEMKIEDIALRIRAIAANRGKQ